MFHLSNLNTFEIIYKYVLNSFLNVKWKKRKRSINTIEYYFNYAIQFGIVPNMCAVRCLHVFFCVKIQQDYCFHKIVHF